MMHEMVIRDGLLIDGTGAEPVAGSVAIDGDRIVAVGDVEGRGREEIDARGCWITPGFIDLHTHYDGQAIWSERLNPSSSHGVTTAVLGNCGVGFAPCRPADRERLVDVMEGVEDIPGVVMAEGLDWSWETFPQYLDALDARPRDIDVAVYVPHSPLRVYVMGERGAAREAATPDDLAEMRRLTREGVEAGAFGFASSRLFLHRLGSGGLIPSFAAAQEELHAIANGVADAGRGILQFVLDITERSWADEVGALVELARASGRPATFTLATGNEGPREWDDALALMDRANAEGVEITGQLFPRPIGLIAGHSVSTNPFGLCPSYAPLKDLPLAERVAALRQPELRARLLAEPPDAGHPLAAMGRNWAWMFPLGDPPNYAPASSDSVAARAAAAGVSTEEIAYDLLLEDEGRALLYVTLGNFYENKLDLLGEMLRHPHVVLGLGDGGAHYGVICDASFPTFMLTYWTRDREGARFSPAEAVHMLTAVPARVLGLTDRGTLSVGSRADLNVIRPDALALHRPQVVHDLPAGGRRLDQAATGYVATIVGGEIIAANDSPTAARPGRLVRSTAIQ